MLQIALCDDRVEELERVTGLVEEYTRLHPELDSTVRPFQSGYDLLECVKARGGFDLYLLDVMMPEPDGLAVGAAIRARDKEAAIVYLTSSPDYAVASYRVQAMDYLLKPVEREALFALLDRAAERARSALPSVAVRTREGVSVVPLAQIVTVESGDHAARYTLSDGRVLSTGTVRSFDEVAAALLAEPRFLRVGASFVVNMLYVDSMTKEQFTMRGGLKIPIPRLKRGEVRQAFLDFMLQRGRGV